MSRDHFTKKSLIIDQLVAGLRKEIEQSRCTFGKTVYCTSRKIFEGKYHFTCPNLILNK